MLESGVQRRREDEIGRAELLDAPQTLKFGSIDELDLQCSEVDIPMHRVAYQLSRHDEILSYTECFCLGLFAGNRVITPPFRRGL